MATNEFLMKAEAVCIACHKAVGQKRKYTNAEYYTHPIEVASIVRGIGGTDEMIAAAYLHDVVEDTGMELHLIDMMFGPVVAGYVRWLTDISKPEDGNRKARKEIDRNHIAQAPPEAKTIKLADLISNTQTIVKNDKDFAKVYMHEKSLLLGVLRDGDENLYRKARAIVSAYYA